MHKADIPLQQAYTAKQQESSPLHRAFFDEAERLWQSEKDTDTINNAIAAQFLSFGRSCNGNDQLGEQYLRRGYQMAERLGLFDHRNGSDTLDNEQIKSASCAAWSIYNWMV